jgi:hypothetical protein
VDYQLPPSFIPQKTAVAEAAGARHARASVWSIASISLFVFSLLAALGVFAYQKGLVRSLTKLNADLVAARAAFEPAFIAELAAMDRRLRAARELLAGHRSVSPLFSLLEKETLATVRWNSFAFTEGAEGEAKLELQGEAAGFNAVALQSDVFSRQRHFTNPVFADFDVDKSGTVHFRFTTSVSSEFIRYRTHLAEIKVTAPDAASPQTAGAGVLPPAEKTPAKPPVESDGFGDGDIIF